MSPVQYVLIGFSIGWITMGLAWFLCVKFGIEGNTTIVITEGEVIE